jgi:hypothetical protein
MRFTCYNESITAKLLTRASFQGLQYCINLLLLVPILKKWAYGTEIHVIQSKN